MVRWTVTSAKLRWSWHHSSRCQDVVVPRGVRGLASGIAAPPIGRLLTLAPAFDRVRG